jgi:hypothetical protein
MPSRVKPCGEEDFGFQGMGDVLMRGPKYPPRSLAILTHLITGEA